MLFSLHSTAREAHLRRLLTDTSSVVPVATTARDLAAATGLAPAEAVWAARHSDGWRLRLTDLATDVVDLTAIR